MTFTCDLFKKSQIEHWNETAAECKEAGEVDKISCDYFCIFQCIEV